MMTTEYRNELEQELRSLYSKQDVFRSEYKTERIRRLKGRLNFVSVSLPASEIAVGDYSPEYGTVETVVTDPIKGYLTITFKNDTVITPGPDDEYEIDQGGRFTSPTRVEPPVTTGGDHSPEYKAANNEN